MTLNHMVYVKRGIEYFIKPSIDKFNVLCLGKSLPIMRDILPNAVFRNINDRGSENVVFPDNFFDIIIDNDYLIYSNNLRVFEPIYKVLKMDGTLLAIGYDKDDIGVSKEYMFLARYALFDDFTFFEENKSFVINIKKFKNTTLELKKYSYESNRKKIARLLHRLEADLYKNNSMSELAMLCESNKIDDIYLSAFIENTIIYKDRIFNCVCDNEIANQSKRIRDVLGISEYDAQHKIAFIMCVNNDELYDEVLLYLSDLIVPNGYAIEIIDVRGATSMCSGYNRALKSTDAKYKIYIHQDTYIYNKEFIRDILRIFENDDIGCIGLVGCMLLPKSGIWWRSNSKRGKVIIEKEFEECNVLDYGIINGLYENVEAVDGFLLATQYDIEWREDIFTGWHFYDISMCMEMKRHGYEVVVANQGDEYWALHCPGNKMLDLEYEEFRKIFLSEYYKGITD